MSRASHTPVKDERGIAQFFFEQGYGACWADAFMALPNLPQSFPLSDAAVEKAWAVLPFCQDSDEDYVAFDARKALADAAPELLEALERMMKPQCEVSRPITVAFAQAAIAKATGEVA